MHVGKWCQWRWWSFKCECNNWRSKRKEKKKREEGATFFTMWLCFSSILAFIKIIYHTYSGSNLASSLSFPSSNRMCPSPLWFWHIIWLLFFSPHCHCHNYTTCTLDLWKALFRKCLLNNRKVQNNIRKYLIVCPLKGFQLTCLFFPKLCVFKWIWQC